MSNLKAVFISDTHGKHAALNLPTGDILFHTGDVAKFGTKEEIIEFLDWFEHLDFPHKVFVAGNHDFFFEQADSAELASMIPANVHYLNDTGVVLEGHHIWGSPIQPTFLHFAFNRNRGAAIRQHWDLIPNTADILLTHGPPFQILDQTVTGLNVGCEDLLQAIKRVQPRIHAFGHIHEAYGREKQGNCTFINGSVLDVNYRLSNDPVVVEL